jgi:hypothetical protein
VQFAAKDLKCQPRWSSCAANLIQPAKKENIPICNGCASRQLGELKLAPNALKLYTKSNFFAQRKSQITRSKFQTIITPRLKFVCDLGFVIWDFKFRAIG